MDTAHAAPEEKIAHELVDAAMWAPSVHDTRPWRFGIRGSTISMYADGDRRLTAADPYGREMLISCGAALYTLCLATRQSGRRPEVRIMPDPEEPCLVAEVDIGPPHATTAEERRMHEQIKRRRGHRGGFRPGGLPPGLLQALRGQAYAERVSLRIAADPRVCAALSALTDAAEQIQRQDPAYAAEAARWACALGDTRGDEGTDEGGSRGAIDPGYSARDVTPDRHWGPSSGDRQSAAGVVALLATCEDGRRDWLRAGRALQRILLCAAGHDVSAAFHAPALEVPELREFIRGRFCDASYPQMILRLGLVLPRSESVRRSPTELTRGAL